MTQQELLAAIRAEVARAGIPRSELAAVVGVSKGQMYRKLRGEQPLTVMELSAIAAHLEVPVADLLPKSEVGA